MAVTLLKTLPRKPTRLPPKQPLPCRKLLTLPSTLLPKPMPLLLLLPLLPPTLRPMSPQPLMKLPSLLAPLPMQPFRLTPLPLPLMLPLTPLLPPRRRLKKHRSSNRIAGFSRCSDTKKPPAQLAVFFCPLSMMETVAKRQRSLHPAVNSAIAEE